MATTPKQRASTPKVRALVTGPKPLLKPLGKNGFKYREQYGVIVLCRDEKHQAKTYEALCRRGHQCRVVSV